MGIFALLNVPNHDVYGDPFHPVLVDDVRAAYAMWASGRRWRALRLFWRVNREFDPREVELLYYAVGHAARRQ
jgi:hypothetical protein